MKTLLPVLFLLAAYPWCTHAEGFQADLVVRGARIWTVNKRNSPKRRLPPEFSPAHCVRRLKRRTAPLTLSTTSGLNFSFSDSYGTGAGSGYTTMTFRGTIAIINSALNGLTMCRPPTTMAPPRFPRMHHDDRRDVVMGTAFNPKRRSKRGHRPNFRAPTTSRRLRAEPHIRPNPHIRTSSEIS